jgi:predicted AlkP superfamily phosphohydrolase/phosphomutase
MADDAGAFALDPGRIYLHLEDRYPRGSVASGDREPLIDEVTQAFDALQFEGRKVITRVFRREEIYQGPLLGQAPDLVLLANEGFSLRGSIKSRRLYGAGSFKGKHTQADAFLLAWGRQASEATPELPNVSDVVGIADRLRSRRRE